MQDELTTDVFGVGWGNSLRQLMQIHPIDSHRTMLDFERNTPHAHFDGTAKVLAVRGRGESWGLQIVTTGQRDYPEARLEVPMTAHVKPETGATESYGRDQWSTADILDDVRDSGFDQPLADLWDEVGTFRDVIGPPPIGRESLAWGTGPDEIVSVKREGKGIALDESSAAVIRLRVEIDGGYIETSPAKSFGYATGTAEEIESAHGSPIVAQASDGGDPW